MNGSNNAKPEQIAQSLLLMTEEGRQAYLAELRETQRVALGVLLVPHFDKHVTEAEHLEAIRTHRSQLHPAILKAADAVGTNFTSIRGTLQLRKRNEKVFKAMLDGRYDSISQARRDAGYRPARSGEGALRTGNTDATGRNLPPAYYGRGDKFVEATEPLRRYLRAWRDKGFRFTAVNPAEARTRLKALTELLDGIQQTIADLETRSVEARLNQVHKLSKAERERKAAV